MFRITESAGHALLCLLVVTACSLGYPQPVDAATWVVGSCSDSGPGSLREAIAQSESGDVVDLRSIGCSRLVLTSGALVIPRANFTIVGPGRYTFTLDGNDADRVIAHDGAGTLRLVYLSVANGRRNAITQDERGGCIRSFGSVELHHVSVHDCLMHEDGFDHAPPTNGGGISANNRVTLSYSSVFRSAATDDGLGGGIYGEGKVTLYHSQVYENHAYEAGGVFARGALEVTYSRVYRNRATLGGGGLSMGSYGRPIDGLLINKSTISNNVLDDFAGRQIAGAGGGAGPRTITDSTFSGNRSYLNSAASIEGEARIYNSTFAYNTEIQIRNQAFPSTACEDRGALQADALRLESTIVARNACTAGAAGFDIAADTGVVTGHRNLIERPRVAVPADTLAVDPLLAPLADNGGYSATHLPRADGPVLQRGNNVLDRQYDQRGPGFPRVKGGLPDIGATER